MDVVDLTSKSAPATRHGGMGARSALPVLSRRRCCRLVSDGGTAVSAGRDGVQYDRQWYCTCWEQRTDSGALGECAGTSGLRGALGGGGGGLQDWVSTETGPIEERRCEDGVCTAKC